MAVVTSIADEVGVEPVDLQPLAESIDPEAIDRLFPADGDETTVLSFSHAGVDVTITADGVSVDG